MRVLVATVLCGPRGNARVTGSKKLWAIIYGLVCAFGGGGEPEDFG